MIKPPRTLLIAAAATLLLQIGVIAGTAEALPVDDSRGDLFAFNLNDSGRVSAHRVDAVGAFHTFTMQKLTRLSSTYDDRANWVYKVADFNGDRVPDLYAIDRNDEGWTSVHVLDGATDFDQFLLQTVTVLHATAGGAGGWDYDVADYNADGRADLYAVNRDDDGRTAVHVLDAASAFHAFAADALTPLSATLDPVWDFAAADYDGDRRADLYVVNRNDSGRTAVHVLDAGGAFQTFKAQTLTPLGATTDPVWQFDAADYNADGHGDLYALNRNDGGKTAVHVLDATSGFHTFTANALSAMPSTNNPTWVVAIADPGLGLPSSNEPPTGVDWVEPKPIPAGIVERDDDPVPPFGGTSGAPIAAGPATVSGYIARPDGAAVANLPVLISTLPDESGATTEIGEATTDSSGKWTFTMPDELPSDVQEESDDNGGVLNVVARSMAVVPGTDVAMIASSTIPVGVASGEDATKSSEEARQSQPAVAELVVANDSMPTEGPTQAEIDRSPAGHIAFTRAASPKIGAPGAPDPSAWQSPAGSPAFNPGMSGGVDYSSAVVAAPSTECLRPFMYSEVIDKVIRYTVVGEAHAYWDAHGGVTYGATGSVDISAGASMDGKYWHIDGSVTLSKKNGIKVDSPAIGPRQARQFKVPIEYIKSRTTAVCGPVKTVYDYVTPKRYLVPEGGAVAKFGADVSKLDGPNRYAAAPHTAHVRPGWKWGVTAGRSDTWALAASVGGFGPSVTVSNSDDTYQWIEAGQRRDFKHDIFSYTGRFCPECKSGTFYSF